MFTGIVNQTGTVKKITQKNGVTTMVIKAPGIAKTRKTGNSIAVDGVCLTITRMTRLDFTVEAIPETLNLTIIKNYNEGTVVNLENPLKMGAAIDGHFVSGHVDFVARIKNISQIGDSKIVTIAFSENMAKFFAFKGSVAVNGVSLTISKLDKNSFEVSLIPQTLKTTNLGTLTTGSEVNIEIDLISRYLDSLLQAKAEQTNYEFLRERGFI